VLSVIGCLLALYLVWRLIWPLRLPRPVRIALGLLVVALALHHRIVAQFAGTMASPEIPKAMIAVLATGFTTLLLSAVFVLLLDALLLIAWLVRARRVLPTLRATWLRPAAGALALLLSAYGIWQGMAVPKPRQIEVAIDGLPAAFDGYRVLQLTDIHASRLLTGAWVEKVVAESNALHPDLVVITGDLIDGSVSARANDFAPLARLHAPDGVIAITGNHEYYAQYAEWMQAFRGQGMQVLENTHTRVQRDGATSPA